MARRKTQQDDLPLPKLTRENWRESLRMLEFVRPYRWQLIWGLILLFLSSAVFMAFPMLTGMMFDVAQAGLVEQANVQPDLPAGIEQPTLSLTLNQFGILLIIILSAQAIVSYIRVICFANVSERGTADLRKALYNKLISLPVVFYEKNRVGDLISRLTADVERLYNVYSITLAEFLRQIILLISGIIFLVFTAWQLALIMLGTFPVIVVFALFFGRMIRKLSKERQDALAETNNVLSETMQAIQVVKSFTNELLESIRYGNSIDKVVKVALKYARGRALFASFIIFFLFGALFFVIWSGVKLVENGTMTGGQLITFVFITGIIGGAIAGLGNFYTEILGAIGATDRIREILNEETEVNLANANRKALNLKGNIRYENVHFQYPTRLDVPVLRGLNLEVKAGQKIALVGPSGAGKSTIVQLLLQFYNFQSGKITVDGHSIDELDITSFRENIAFVPQEVMLFGGTIRENILYGKPEATEEEVLAAAAQANALEFIEQFPEGLETVVGERGIKLSGGQRQRIAIARAILRDPAILLLDEATSSLDAESERVVQDALNKLMENRTSIIIAHRLATIREVDMIFVIDGGKIVEKGTHEELSAMQDGIYNSLAKLQFDLVQ